MILTPTVNFASGEFMKEISESKKKAIKQVLDKIAETGSPTSNQIIFLELFFNEEIKEKE